MSHNSSLREALSGILGPEGVMDDPDILKGCAVDGMEPRAVVLPASTEEAARVVDFARAGNLAVLPMGSGSKMAGGSPPERLDLIISTGRLNRVVDMDTANLTVTAEAGVPFREIQAALAGEENRCYSPLGGGDGAREGEICSERENRGCFIPMMPPCCSTATIGGIIAANSSGPTSLLYGLPRDLVLGIRYVTPEGRIVGMGGKTVKNVSGLDLCKLMIGSRGTLGIICEATLRLLPLPERTGTGIFLFSGPGPARRCVDEILGSGMMPASVELFNHRAWQCLLPERARLFNDGGYGVAVALEGVGEAVERMRRELEEMGRAPESESYSYLEGMDQNLFWEGFSDLDATLLKTHPELVSGRLTFPISEYGEVVESADSLLRESLLDCALLCRAGCGVASLHIPLSPGDDDTAQKAVSLLKGVLGKCEEKGGNLVIERSPLGLKKRLPPWGRAPEGLAVMKRIKEQMDPGRLFSPGRFVGGI